MEKILNSVLNLIKPKCKKKLSDEIILQSLKEVYELGQKFAKEYAEDTMAYHDKYQFHSHATLPQPYIILDILKQHYKKLHGKHKASDTFTSYKGPDVDKNKDGYYHDYFCTYKDQIERNSLTFWKALYLLYFMGWVNSYHKHKKVIKTEPLFVDLENISPEVKANVKKLWEDLDIDN